MFSIYYRTKRCNLIYLLLQTLFRNWGKKESAVLSLFRLLFDCIYPGRKSTFFIFLFFFLSLFSLLSTCLSYFRILSVLIQFAIQYRGKEKRRVKKGNKYNIYRYIRSKKEGKKKEKPGQKRNIFFLSLASVSFLILFYFIETY